MPDHFHSVELFDWKVANVLRQNIQDATTVEQLKTELLNIVDRLASSEICTSADDCLCQHEEKS